MVKVSIIMPVYNVEMYLEECLDSVVHQTLKDIEIICVNDGSTDNSLKILEKYAAKDKRVKVISKLNSGYGHTMNVGIDAATGEYIGIVEPDDYIKENMYETLYNLAKEKNLDLIKANFCRFKGDTQERRFVYVNLAKDSQYYNKVLKPEDNVEIFRFVMNTWSGIYNREFLNKYRIRHNETPGASFQDNGFWFQTFCRAERVYFVDKAFYMNRRDNPNSSVKNKEKVYAAANEYKYIRNFLEKNKDLKEKYIYMFSLKKFHNYNFTLERIAQEFKLEFLKYYANDFKLSIENGEVAKDYFTPKEWGNLMLIINSPELYYKKRYLSGKKNNRNIKELAWKTISSLKNYGLTYTLNKIKEKVFLK